MKKLMVLLVACALLLCGCGGKSQLAGVYETEATFTDENIILKKDGTCSYLGENNATWSVRGTELTIITYYPDHYYIDVCMEETMEWHLSVYPFAFQEAAPDITGYELFQSENRIRIEVNSKDALKQTCNIIKDFEYVASAEAYTQKGGKSTHKLEVAGNCLILMGVVFIKVN